MLQNPESNSRCCVFCDNARLGTRSTKFGDKNCLDHQSHDCCESKPPRCSRNSGGSLWKWREGRGVVTRLFEFSRYTVRSRTNGNSNKWKFQPKLRCYLFANKWKFKQMEISGWKSLSFDQNGKIYVQNLSNKVLSKTKTHTFRKWKCTICCNFFANKWKFEQMEICATIP